MIKILTAVGNKNINNLLQKEKNIKIIKEDIFYKEGILEVLEKNNKIDILILYEKLEGEIDIITLIKNIKKINNKINIFFIMENKNIEIEKLLKEENIENIFYNNEININEFIKKIKEAEINVEENLKKEIKILKNIINKKDEELFKYKKNKEIIIITGDKKVGKTIIIKNIKKLIKNKKEIFLKEKNIINFYKNENKNMYKIIFVLEATIEKIKINMETINELILKNKIDIKKTYLIFNKIDKYSINKKIIKKIFKKYKIIGFIKKNKYYDYSYNEKNNLKYENIKLKKEYLKIINEI